MKSKILFLVSVILAGFGYSQTVKVKKGEIQVNEKSVAKISREKGIYTISDLSGKPLFTAVITDKTPLKNTASKRWLELTGTNGVVRELDLIPQTSFSLGFEKPITENLTLSSDPLIPASGIDDAKISRFFQKEDRSISKAEDEVIEKEKKIARIEDSLAALDKVVIGKSGNITSKGNKIGYIVLKEEVHQPGIKNYSYNVLDINKLMVAKILFSDNDLNNEMKGLVINTYNGETLPVKARYKTSVVENDELALRVVNKLYANGYTLGDMKSQIEATKKEKGDAINEMNKKAEEEAKANSLNIYDVEGYLIDANGNKKEGKITMEFESISSKLGREKNIVDITSYGTFVLLDVNGKKETYKAKDGVKFCVGSRCFLGTSGSEDGGTGNSSGSQLGVFGESLFFEIQGEKDNNYVLNYVKNPQYYYIKLAKQSKAVYLGDKATFGNKKQEKVRKIFDEYMKCSALDFSKYDTKTKEGLVQVLSDYSSNCK